MPYSIESIALTAPSTTWRAVLFGTSAIGKTSMGAETPNPILIDVEGGTGTLRIPSFGLLKTYQEVIEVIRVLYRDPHDRLTAVFDSLDWFEPLVWEETCRRHRWKTIEDPGYGKGFLAADVVWREFLDALNALRIKRGMSILLIAHSTVQRFESPTSEAYDRFSIKLHKRASAIVAEAVDCIWFYTYRINITHDRAGGFGKDGKARATGSGQRVIYTTERPGYVAKNRYSMPPVIDIPDDAASAWSTLAQYLPSTNTTTDNTTLGA